MSMNGDTRMRSCLDEEYEDKQVMTAKALLSLAYRSRLLLRKQEEEEESHILQNPRRNLNWGSTFPSFFPPWCSEPSFSSQNLEETRGCKRTTNMIDSKEKRKASTSPKRGEPREPPEWVRQASGGGETPRLIFEKTLTTTDLNISQSRLLIPFKQLLINDFLTPAQERGVNKDKGLETTIVVNQSSKKRGLYFKIWHMEKTSNYVLNRKWNDVVRDNQLKKDDMISLWTLKQGNEEDLCFALDILRK